MKKPQYQKEVDSLLFSLKKNLKADYDDDFNQQNEKNIMKLYQQVYKFQDQNKQEKQYLKLKGFITNKAQLKILQWFETIRSKKYSGDILPSSKINANLKSIKICINPDFLRPSRAISYQLKNISVLEHSSLNDVQLQAQNKQGKLNKYRFSLQRQYQSSKTYLFKQFKNRSPAPTPWLMEKTQDQRYVWRGDIKIDHFDVQTLLKFILAVRKGQSDDDCPSILINAGCHGGDFGQNAFQSANLNLTDMNIYYETIHQICQIINKPQYKLTKKNVVSKINLHPLSTVTPCVYPQNADHIIDVFCNGALMKVQASQLHLLESRNNEKDLMFLYGKGINKIKNFNL